MISLIGRLQNLPPIHTRHRICSGEAKLCRSDTLFPMLRLSTLETNDLLAQPETGMGYQVVDAILWEGNKKERGIVYNAELLFLSDETQSRLRSLSYADVLESAKSSGNEIKELRVFTREQLAHRTPSIRGGSGAPAKDARIEKTKLGEVFKRFSAYVNDRRLRRDGSWRAGTYATTEEDAENVKTGMDAVARYALPNPAPASYVFTGRPDKDTEIKKGTAAPAHGQPGGGVEVIFTEGTQRYTVTGPRKIAG